MRPCHREGPPNHCGLASGVYPDAYPHTDSYANFTSARSPAVLHNPTTVSNTATTHNSSDGLLHDHVILMF